jgi:hypothetical protein
MGLQMQASQYGEEAPNYSSFAAHTRLDQWYETSRERVEVFAEKSCAKCGNSCDKARLTIAEGTKSG